MQIANKNDFAKKPGPLEEQSTEVFSRTWDCCAEQRNLLSFECCDISQHLNSFLMELASLKIISFIWRVACQPFKCFSILMKIRETRQKHWQPDRLRWHNSICEHWHIIWHIYTGKTPWIHRETLGSSVFILQVALQCRIHSMREVMKQKVLKREFEVNLITDHMTHLCIAYRSFLLITGQIFLTLRFIRPFVGRLVMSARRRRSTATLKI